MYYDKIYKLCTTASNFRLHFMNVFWILCKLSVTIRNYTNFIFVATYLVFATNFNEVFVSEVGRDYLDEHN